MTYNVRVCVQIVVVLRSVNEILIECCRVFRQVFLRTFRIVFFKKKDLHMTVFVLDRMDDGHDDQLDFYDFLDIVAEKFDSLAQQSREDSIDEYQHGRKETIRFS